MQQHAGERRGCALGACARGSPSRPSNNNSFNVIIVMIVMIVIIVIIMIVVVRSSIPILIHLCNYAS